ncbi:MAG: hypothetical protein QW231_00175 [Candidatus Bathyarchaeia archaeon]
MVKVAFAKAVINDLWPAQQGWGYHDDIEARCMYFSSSDQSLIFIALDIGILSRRRDSVLREEIARRLNVSTEEILVHCIQAHNAVPYTQVYLDQVAERVAEAMRPAIAKAREAEISFACANVNSQFSVNRRKYVNDDLGVCTFWDGYRKEGTRADAAHLVTALRKSLLSSRPSNIYGVDPQNFPVSGGLTKVEGLEPIWYDRPVDPLVQFLVFRTLNGENLGSLLRFSTHVQTAVVPLAQDKLYTADFPHYTRKRLEEALGGIAIFASGPAGNIVPLQEGWTWKETERYGNALADAALAEYSKTAKFEPLTRLKVRSHTVDLPVRMDMPTSVEEARRRADLIREELNNAAAIGAPLRQIKRMADLLNHYEWSPNKLVSWNYLDPEEAHRRKVTIRLTGVALNDILILGMPGEAVCETSLWLRANSVGIKLLTLYDCNGDIGYMPEAQDYPHGGYEAACSIIAPDGETYLREGALTLIQEICQ